MSDQEVSVVNDLVCAAFRLPGALAPNARRVSVVGSFNGWDPATHPLTKTPEGDWTIRLYLTPGRFVYGFCVDGACRPDPHDEGRVPNGGGAEWSVRHVLARAG